MPESEDGSVGTNQTGDQKKDSQSGEEDVEMTQTSVDNESGNANLEKGTEEPQEDGSEAAEKAEPTYSTRGRTSEKDQDALDRLTRNGQGELEREKPPTISTASFLSDTLTEEERRTRTRYLPDVDGMHPLRKQEVKGDLALARAINAGSKRFKGNDDAMDVDDLSATDDPSDANRRILEFDGKELSIPNPAFVAPVQDSSSTPNPNIVGTISAFDPTRPPESVGAKKAHRMARWESRPADIKIDLNNYRKTVQRTREELHNALEEKVRVEDVQDHLRRHFLQHLDCLNVEWDDLNEELATSQQACINAADLPTSRTRRRGTGKNGNVMRDVIQVLCTRGTQLNQKSIPLDAHITDQEVPAGMGGVGIKSIHPWDGSTLFEEKKAAEAWLLPGDTCSTPYGDGVVEGVFPAVYFESKGTENGASNKKVDGEELQVPAGARAAVKLPFGVGYFPIDSLSTKECPTSYDDNRLTVRWKGLAETAVAMGSVLDLESMARVVTEDGDEPAAMDEGDDTDEAGKGTDFPTKPRATPFGSTLLPIATVRGQSVNKRKLEALEEDLHEPLFNGEGVLGGKENPNVTKAISAAEIRNQERIELKAKVLHLRHKLYHQRRIRMLNGRTYEATLDRVNRADALVAEMRTDLKSLRSRLQDEVETLGITEGQVGAILASFYKSLDSQHTGEASPPKRSRRSVQSSDDEDESTSRAAESGTEGESSRQ